MRRTVTAAAVLFVAAGCGPAAAGRPEVSAEGHDAAAARAVRPVRANVPVHAAARALRRSSRGVRDFDGDGRADLVVGMPGANRGAGRVVVFAGAGLARVLGSADGTESGAGLGAAVAFAGDVNGDGFGDVVVGAPGADGGRGRAWWIAGGHNGATMGAEFSLAGGALRVAVADGARFGAAVAGVGDVNGDGFDDVAVGAPGAGWVRVFFGSRLGPVEGEAAGVTLWGRDGGSARFGEALAGAADADGDGFDDVAVGAPGARGECGRVGLFLGGTAGTETTPAVWLAGPDGRGGEFGASVVLGDFDGDGFADLAVGAPGARGGVGRARVYFGGRYGVDTEPAVVLDGPNLMDPDFGRALARVPDADGDGAAELLVGAPGAFDGDGWAGMFSPGAARAGGEPVRWWGNRDGVARGMAGALAAGALASSDGAGSGEDAPAPASASASAPAVVLAGDARAEVYPAGWSAPVAAGAVAVSSGDGPLAVAVVGEER